MNSDRRWNIPNVLSGYRLLALPFIVWTILLGDKQVYILLLSINLITDILDGFIARRFNMETEFGARLDSLADIGTYAMAFTGMVVLESAFVRIHWMEFTSLIVVYILVQLISLARFKCMTSFHLYSSKVVGYVQGIFIFTYFVVGYEAWYFYLMLGLSYLNYLEELIIITRIPAMRSNVKGIYFMLKEHKRIQ